MEALEVIEEAASRALADLRGLVGALRDRDEADLAPQRGVADIERLVHGPGDGPRVEVQLASATVCARSSARRSTASPRSRSRTLSGTHATRRESTCTSPATTTPFA